MFGCPQIQKTNVCIQIPSGRTVVHLSNLLYVEKCDECRVTHNSWHCIIELWSFSLHFAVQCAAVRIQFEFIRVPPQYRNPSSGSSFTVKAACQGASPEFALSPPTILDEFTLLRLSVHGLQTETVFLTFYKEISTSSALEYRRARRHISSGFRKYEYLHL